MSSDIFISYAREDRERVQPIAEALAQRGYDVWWDKGLRSGEDYRDRIEEMLQTAKCVVVAWSRHSVESDFVIDEAGRGHRRRVLLPVFIDPGIEPPLGFGGIHTSDLSGWLNDPADPAFEQFVGDVASVVGGDRTPAPPPPAPAIPPRPAGAAKPRLWPFAAGGAALLLVTTAVYLSSRVMTGGVARPMRDTTQVAGGPVAGVDSAGPVTPADPAGPVVGTDSARPVAGVDSGVPASPTSAVAALRGLSCNPTAESGNPLERRRQRLARPPFSVDTATHLLLDQRGEPVPGGAVARFGKLRSRQVLVAHFTGLPDGQGERWLQRSDAGGSLHLIISGNGSVRQMLPFDLASFHAGQSAWGGLQNISLYSIGIGMDNLGPLQRRGDEWEWGLSRTSSRRVPRDSVVVVRDSTGTRGWHRYSDAQLQAFFHVACALRRAYPTVEQLVGHGDVSTRPKVEPGPAFPMDAMRSRLFPER